jgi:hypothetical protein
MKNTRFILSSIFVTLLSFGGVLYSSCTKDACKDITCQHGGSCVNGFCSCPSGYTGTYCETPNLTAVVFTNNTFTPVKITLNSVTKSVSAGKTISYYGNWGDTLRASATTQGNYGATVTWNNIKKAYPIKDTVHYNINLPGSYFYLYVVNNTLQEIKNVFVNYHMTGQETLDILSIPSHVTFGIGYYKLYYNSNVRLESDTAFHYWEFNNLGLDTGHVNQSFTAQAN